MNRHVPPIAQRVSFSAPPGEFAENFDTNGDDVIDVVVTRYTDGRVGRNIRKTYTDGREVIYWGDQWGRVYWEQRRRPDGLFENGFDRDHDGELDDLRVGKPGYPTTIYLLR
jgi:hypothetical protein